MAERNHTSRESSTKQIRISTAYYPAVDQAHLPREIPQIRLCGIWLINAGFSPGDIVTIRATRGRLAIARA